VHSSPSVEGIVAAARVIDPVFCNTPQFHSDPLGLVLKVETVNPIRSFKGRGADYLLSTLIPGGPDLVCASAGNFGQGLAYAARKRGFRAVVFAAESANPLKVERMRQLGADVRLAGNDFDAAKQHARDFARESGGHFIEDGLEPAIAEGAGTIALELCRWPQPIDMVMVPLGNGALITGIGLWMKAHSPVTKVIGVCAAGAPAMEISWRERRAVATAEVRTIADGIAVRIPIPESLPDLYRLLDDVVLVEDDALRDAMRLVLRHHGLVTEPAGVAGLAAAITYVSRFQGALVATPLCGGNSTVPAASGLATGGRDKEPGS
jgi:threonine dehydratase